MTSSAPQMVPPTRVFIIVHELFGIYLGKDSISLLPPVVPPCKDTKGKPHEHKYAVARFKNGSWGNDYIMIKGGRYSVGGLIQGTPPKVDSRFSACPSGNFQVDPQKPYCIWTLPLPKNIYQLRLVNISSRPVFTGNPHGNAVDAQLKAIAIAQAFEFETDPNSQLGIREAGTGAVPLDYTPDNLLGTISLHLWAQLEDESDMDDSTADMHAKESTHAVSSLFHGLVLDAGPHSVSVDDLFATQPSKPLEIRFPEMMTLAEKFQMQSGKGHFTVTCSARTCGTGGNLFVAAQ